MTPAFWSTETFLERQKKHSIVSNFDEIRLNHGRYSLRLSREVLVTPDGTSDGPKCGEGPHLRIPPGQFALLFTLESIEIPNDAIGFISVKTAQKYKGLVNISGFHADPGFKGHLKFSVYNAGDRLVCLDYESECFLLWICSLDQPTKDTWISKNRFQKCQITAEDHELMCERRHSPAALNQRIQKLEDHVNSIIAVGLVIIFPFLVGFASTTFDNWLGKTAATDKPTILRLIVGTSVITCFVVGALFAGYRFWRRRKSSY